MDLKNGSTSASDRKIEIELAYAIAIPFLSFVTTVGNLLILVAFLKIPSLWVKPSEALILNLSVVDLLTGAVVLPLWACGYIAPGYWPFGETGCKLAIIFVNIATQASLYTLISISIDRLLLVVTEYPQYLKLQSRYRVRVTIFCCWTLSMFGWVIEIALWDFAKTIDQTAGNVDYTKRCLSPPRRLESFSTYMFVTLYWTPIMTICGLSVAFLFFLRKRLKKSRTSGMASQELSQARDQQTTQDHSQGSAKGSSTTSNRYIKPAVTLLILVLAMAICMLPYCLYVMIIELFCETCTSFRLLYIFFLLQFGNACIDPFLYGMTQRKIRHFYMSCFSNKIQPTWPFIFAFSQRLWTFWVQRASYGFYNKGCKELKIAVIFQKDEKWVHFQWFWSTIFTNRSFDDGGKDPITYLALPAPFIYPSKWPSTQYMSLRAPVSSSWTGYAQTILRLLSMKLYRHFSILMWKAWISFERNENLEHTQQNSYSISHLRRRCSHRC